MAERITPRDDDFSRWYTDVVTQAMLADYSPVRGCMVIRPNGYELWERMKATLDGMIKATGHRNAYFPLFIPHSFMQKEADHVEGFAPECAVVTHGGGKELEEPLYVRPTSETVICSMFSKWIMSYRDLPLLINQWANVVRWEMRTRLFLRTMEFLWQEGHTAHASQDEAEEETLKILELYTTFVQDYLAIPLLKGKKTDREKFAGAVDTYAIEALMQDGRVLQAGTSHFLGQNFARPFDISFQDEDGKQQFAWQTSWGVTTRLIGAIVLVHADDNGLILPPKIAPRQIVTIPIFRGDEERSLVVRAAERIHAELESQFSLVLDDRDTITPGRKFFEWEVQGLPLRIEIGPREVNEKTVCLARRDTGEKQTVPQEGLRSVVSDLLEDIQGTMFQRAKRFLDDSTREVESFAEFERVLQDKGGFLIARWCGREACEATIQEETKATIRVVPLEPIKADGTCIRCEEKAQEAVYFGKAY